jgi:PadR family transcriptional regulator, regulatory protein PadR
MFRCMRTDLLKGHVDLVLLSCLREGPAHGYLIVKRLRDRSDGEFELLEGTLYPALHRLEESGFVTSRWSIESGRRRRVYRLTRRGAAVLRERVAEWREFSDTVNLVLRGAS